MCKMIVKIIQFVIIAMILTTTESMNHGDFISITSAPYFVTFIATDKNIPYCGGAIIAEYWILTAAHCTVALISISSVTIPLLVRAGSTIRTSNGDIHEIEKIYVYGNYEHVIEVGENSIGYNDIALYKLKTPITFDEYKQPIKVNSQLPTELGTVTIIGIGNEGQKKNSQSMKVASLEPYPFMMEEMNKSMPSVLVIRGFGPEVCAGDSGSPAVFNGELIGVLSGGPPCGEWKVSPREWMFKGAAMYTRTDIFFDWIMQLTGIKY